MAEQQPFASFGPDPFASVGIASNPEPRCPCVLLLDVSGSMAEVVADAGKDLGQTVQQDGQTYRVVSGGVSRIDKLNEGLRTYQSELMGDSLAAQRVEVSVITFGSRVETVCPFVIAQEFNAPTLTANGETPLGAAILQAIDAVAERKRVYKQNGLHYYRPWIFMITDGEPTDSWQEAANKVKEGEKNKNFSFFAVGVEGANFEKLRQISTREPLPLKGYSFREMFLWLSQSQKSVSQSNPGQEGNVKLPSPSGWAELG
ncbi:MAG: vWA domain-containing protein [Gemmataceae bacterium]